MAEAMSRTLNAGPDDASTNYCEPCGNVLAEAYCLDCPEYLCSTCANVHEKQRISKTHRLLRGTAMPSSHPTTPKPVSDTGRFIMCPQHPEDEIKFFCETHDVVCCMACSVVLHKECNNVVYMPEVAQNYKTGPEYKQLIGDLNKTQQLAAQYLTDIKQKMKAVEQLKTTETTKLEKYRAEIKACVEECVDKRIDELTSEVTQLRDSDMSLLKDKHDKTNSIACNTTTTKRKLEACEEKPCELFMESKHTRNVVAQLQVDLEDIAANAEYHVYSIRKDTEMTSVLKNKVELANIHLKTALSPGCMTRLKELTVTSPGDVGLFIPDIAVFSPSRLLVADFYHGTLMLLDSVEDRTVSKVKLSTSPLRICLLTDGRVVVTLDKMRKIQFCRVDGETLSLDRSIDVNIEGQGIAECDNGNLIVSCLNPPKVVMMTMDGQVIDEMDNEKAGKYLFSDPYFVATSASGNIFVSNVCTKTIIQMDRTLCMTRIFTSPMLTSPRGIVSVRPDQLLVADRDSNSILILNPTSGEVTLLLGQADGIQSPWAVAWCTYNKKLYVGFVEYSKTLSVFCQKCLI